MSPGFAFSYLPLPGVFPRSFAVPLSAVLAIHQRLHLVHFAFRSDTSICFSKSLQLQCQLACNSPTGLNGQLPYGFKWPKLLQTLDIHTYSLVAAASRVFAVPRICLLSCCQSRVFSPGFLQCPFCSACNPPMVTLRALCSQVSAFVFSDTSTPLDLTRLT